MMLAGTPPEEVRWADPASPHDLFAARTSLPGVTARRAGVVPKRFLALAGAAICHADPDRFGLLYQLLWRLQKARTLTVHRHDPAVGQLYRRADAVLAEARRVQGGLRFRRAVAGDGHKGIAAWCEPAHYVLERVAPHFVREYGHEQWSIATPYRTAFWDGKALSYGPAGRRPGAPAED